jgi:hypothetical protein
MTRRLRFDPRNNSVTLNLNRRESNRVVQVVAEALVDRLGGSKKSTPSTQITLKKPPAKKKKRKTDITRGPIKYRSKDVDFSVKENRIKETRALARKVKRAKKVSIRKAATMLEYRTFTKNKLGKLMSKLKNSPYRAVSEAYPKLRIMPWEMSFCPRKFWETKKNRVAAIEWVLKKTGKDPIELQLQDLQEYHLDRLTQKKRLYELLVEANCAFSMRTALAHAKKTKFSNEKIYPWQKEKTFAYGRRINRVITTKWLVWKVGQEGRGPEEIEHSDFAENGFGKLLERYKGSYRLNKKDPKWRYKAALHEAGFNV